MTWITTWKQHIDQLKEEYVGKKVNYENRIHTIVDVDMNGILHIDLPSQYNKTTAALFPYEADKILV